MKFTIDGGPGFGSCILRANGLYAGLIYKPFDAELRALIERDGEARAEVEKRLCAECDNELAHQLVSEQAMADSLRADLAAANERAEAERDVTNADLEGTQAALREAHSALVDANNAYQDEREACKEAKTRLRRLVQKLPLPIDYADDERNYAAALRWAEKAKEESGWKIACETARNERDQAQADAADWKSEAQSHFARLMKYSADASALRKKLCETIACGLAGDSGNAIALDVTKYLAENPHPGAALLAELEALRKQVADQGDRPTIAYMSGHADGKDERDELRAMCAELAGACKAAAKTLEQHCDNCRQQVDCEFCLKGRTVTKLRAAIAQYDAMKAAKEASHE